MPLLDQRSPLPSTLYISYDATDADIATIPDLPYARRIREIRFRGAKLTDRVLEVLVHLPQLERLWLEGYGFTDAALPLIARATKLRELRAIWTSITGGGLSHLRPLQELQSLHLESDKPLQPGLRALAHLPKLCKLSLSYSRLGEGVVQELGALSQIEDLDLSNSLFAPSAEPQGSWGLDGLTSLRTLELHASHLVPAILPQLQAVVGLENLRLTLTRMTVADVAFLAALINLQKLSLPFLPDGALVALTTLSRLRELVLNRYSVTAETRAKLEAAAPGLKIELATMNYDK
jgi:hypothetical protein